MSKYVYENPLSNGYKQFKLSKKQHNKLFKYRQIKWYHKYEYFYSKDDVILHRFFNYKAVTLSTLLFPVSILLTGIINIKECWQDLQKMYNQKKYGAFSADQIESDTDRYDQIMEIIKIVK